VAGAVDAVRSRGAPQAPHNRGNPLDSVELRAVIAIAEAHQEAANALQDEVGERAIEGETKACMREKYR